MLDECWIGLCRCDVGEASLSSHYIEQIHEALGWPARSCPKSESSPETDLEDTDEALGCVKKSLIFILLPCKRAFIEKAVLHLPDLGSRPRGPGLVLTIVNTSDALTLVEWLR